MEHNVSTRKVTPPLTKALVISLILVVLSVLVYVTGNIGKPWTGWVSYGILCAAIIWACINYGSQMNNAVTFGNVFSHGFKTTAIVTIISIVFSVIFLLIFPEIKEQGMEMARQNMQKENQLSDDQIEKGIEIARKFFMVIAIASVLFGYLIVGLIGSLIGAGVTKKNPPTPFDSQVR